MIEVRKLETRIVYQVKLEESLNLASNSPMIMSHDSTSLQESEDQIQELSDSELHKLFSNLKGD